MRSMVEGYGQVVLTYRRQDHSHVPLHHPCGMVPLPVPGRNYPRAPWQCLYFCPEPHGHGSLRDRPRPT